MIFKQINRHKMVAELTQMEVNESGLSFATLHNDYTYTMDVVAHILLQAKQDIGYEPQTTDLTVEIFHSVSGCEIHFTSVPAYQLFQGKPIGIGQPLVYFFKNFEEMLTASIALFLSFCNKVYQSSLHQCGECYYLTLTYLSNNEETCEAFLNDFGELVAVGEIAAASVDEQFHTIIQHNAIDKLTYYFGSPMAACRKSCTPCA